MQYAEISIPAFTTRNHPAPAKPKQVLANISAVRPGGPVPLGVDICRPVLDHCELFRPGDDGDAVVGGPGSQSAKFELEGGIPPAPGKLVVEGECRCA